MLLLIRVLGGRMGCVTREYGSRRKIPLCIAITGALFVSYVYVTLRCVHGRVGAGGVKTLTHKPLHIIIVYTDEET